MAQIAPQPYRESQRMQIKALVRLASDSVAYYWPMRTFVHHNPLHGLEHLAFATAVEKARESLGGAGYLTNVGFRDYFRAGRILLRHLDAALKPRALPEQIKLGVREITHVEVLRACMLRDLSIPADDRFEVQLARHPDRHVIAVLAKPRHQVFAF